MSLDIRLSPSRINSVGDCTWQYYCNYHLGLPRSSNDGNRRGTICHGLLERLIKPNHRHFINKIALLGDPFAFPAIRRYLETYAKKEGLDLDVETVNLKKNGLITHRQMIAEMIVVALKNDFLGREGDEIVTEQDHEEKIKDGDRVYHIKGIIDKQFIRRNKQGEIEEVEIVDYKTSSKKFDKDDIDCNMQGLIYQMFARKMYPTAKRIVMSFIFLRFPNDPWVRVPQPDDEIVEGLEHYLTYISDYMSAFTEEHAKKGFAKHDVSSKFLCGLYGKKKYYNKEIREKVETEEPQFICPVRDPFTYYVVYNDKGEKVGSYKSEFEIPIHNGWKIETKKYGGCPAWHAQDQNLSRDWSILR